MRKPPTLRVAPRAGFAREAHTVAAVDAAKLAPAWALAAAGVLVGCGFDGAPGNASPLPHASELGAGSVVVPICPDVCALEVSPPRGQADGNPTNVFEMNVGGALCAGSMRAGQVVLVYPAEWTGTASPGKGQAKPPRHWIVWGLLSAAERVIVARAGGMSSKTLGAYIHDACEAIAHGRAVKYSDPVHNLLDAVGLLLFALGRMGRGGAKVRS